MKRGRKIVGHVRGGEARTGRGIRVHHVLKDRRVVLEAAVVVHHVGCARQTLLNLLSDGDKRLVVRPQDPDLDRARVTRQIGQYVFEELKELDSGGRDMSLDAASNIIDDFLDVSTLLPRLEEHGNVPGAHLGRGHRPEFGTRAPGPTLDVGSVAQDLFHF